MDFPVRFDFGRLAHKRLCPIKTFVQREQLTMVLFIYYSHEGIVIASVNRSVRNAISF